MRMNSLPAGFFVVAICLFLPSAANCQSAPEPSKPTSDEAAKPPILSLPDTVVNANVPYVNPADRLQTLDIYFPKQASNAPVVLFVHGGGWNKRDKDEVSAQPELFNAAGIIVVSVNYRLVPSWHKP